jgi:hypothetical protein
MPEDGPSESHDERSSESVSAGVEPPAPAETLTAEALPADAPAQTVSEWLAGRSAPPHLHLFLGLFVPLGLAAYLMWRLAPHTVDDAYISFRYARNAARGLGLVYNAGERIEGYTNFLWTVLLAGGARLGVEPEIAAKLLGAASGACAIGMTYALSARLRPFGAVPCVATWLLASSAPFLGYSVFGLETTFFAALLLVGSWLMLREEERGAGWPLSGLVFGVAGLTRPEAPMYIGLLMLLLGGPGLLPLAKRTGGALDDDRRALVLFFGLITAVGVGFFGRYFQHKLPALAQKAVLPLAGLGGAVVLLSLPKALFGKRNLVRGALFAAPVAAHLLWRKAYYGQWLPNTLGAKTGDLRQQLGGGGDYVSRWLDQQGVAIAFVLFGVTAAIVMRHRGALAFAATTALGLAYVALVGGDWMPIFRFIAPIEPFCFLLVCLGVRSLVEERIRFVNYGVLLLALVATGQRGARHEADRRIALERERRFWDRAAGGTARWFAARVARYGREAVHGDIALGDIGQIGYQTDFPILDLLGLVDPVIATLPGGYTMKIGPGYRDRFFDRKPRYFVMISAEGDCKHPSVPGSRSLYNDRRFLQHYALSGRVPLEQNFNWCVYERRDLQPADQPAEATLPPPSAP